MKEPTWDGKLTPADVAKLLAPGGALRALVANERKVFYLLAEGLTTEEAARVLGVKATTAKTKVWTILQKLELHSVAELRAFARDHGLVR